MFFYTRDLSRGVLLSVGIGLEILDKRKGVLKEPKPMITSEPTKKVTSEPTTPGPTTLEPTTPKIKQIKIPRQLQKPTTLRTTSDPKAPTTLFLT